MDGGCGSVYTPACDCGTAASTCSCCGSDVEEEEVRIDKLCCINIHFYYNHTSTGEKILRRGTVLKIQNDELYTIPRYR